MTASAKTSKSPKTKKVAVASKNAVPKPDETAQELIKSELGTEETSGKTKETEETTMTQPEVVSTEVIDLTPDPIAHGDGTPAKTPKEAKAKPAKELTPEHVAAMEEYKQRYGTSKLGEIDLTNHTKTGAKSRMSLEARARMSAAAKARWQDPAKKAQLQEAMAKRSEAGRAGREEKLAAKKAAQEQRKQKREEQLAAEKVRKAAEKASAEKKANKQNKKQTKVVAENTQAPAQEATAEQQ